MASKGLSTALGLLDSADAELQKIRLETPVDYMATPESMQALTGKMRTIDRDYLEQAMVAMDGASPTDREKFDERFGQVHRTFGYLAGEKNEGRLPQSKNAPWPPPAWVTEDLMREDAADAEAEPATNGYGES